MGAHMSMDSYNKAKILEKARIEETERIVRLFHESWDLRDPDRGATVIAEDCHFEDMARGELLPGREGYRRDYHRWREAFPDGEVKVVNVIVQDNWAVVEFVNRGTQTGPCTPVLVSSHRAGAKWRPAIAALCVWLTAWLSRVVITTIRPASPDS